MSISHWIAFLCRQIGIAALRKAFSQCFHVLRSSRFVRLLYQYVQILFLKMALPHRGRRRFAPTAIFPMLQVSKLETLRPVWSYLAENRKRERDSMANVLRSSWNLWFPRDSWGYYNILSSSRNLFLSHYANAIYIHPFYSSFSKLSCKDCLLLHKQTCKVKKLFSVENSVESVETRFYNSKLRIITP